MSPFIHFDGKTLYFASDGRPGMGGFDIYMTRMNDDSTWTEPQNLGYPINTYNDEMGLVIECRRTESIFFIKTGISQTEKIFSILTLMNQSDQILFHILKEKYTDKETGKLLKADYELINLSTNKVTIKSSTDDNGNFLVCLPSGYNYGINVSKARISFLF